eukprot:gene22621-biopygen20757
MILKDAAPQAPPARGKWGNEENAAPEAWSEHSVVTWTTLLGGGRDLESNGVGRSSESVGSRRESEGRAEWGGSAWSLLNVPRLI